MRRRRSARVQYRAVTEDDYRNAALTIAGVAGAVASFRWTGSWYTVFVGIDPVADGRCASPTRAASPGSSRRSGRSVLDGLTRYRLAGYDLEIRSARYVPLDVAIQVCAKPGYFRGDVAHAVALALSAGVSPRRRAGLLQPGQPHASASRST